MATPLCSTERPSRVLVKLNLSRTLVDRLANHLAGALKTLDVKGARAAGNGSQYDVSD